MRRNNNFAVFDGLMPQDEVLTMPLDIPVVTNTDGKEKVFDLIYAPDPLTGLPQNALGVFLNENTSPIVRQFIEANLKAPDANPPIPEGLTDKDLENIVRHRNESLSDYTHRINKYVHDIRRSVQDDISVVNSKIATAKASEQSVQTK